MKFNITSFRGHHEAVVVENDVSQMLFDKLLGRRQEALPKEIREKIPDTFEELTGLWKEGKLGYMAVQKVGEEMVIVKDFDPKIEELVFIAPIIGG